LHSFRTQNLGRTEPNRLASCIHCVRATSPCWLLHHPSCKQLMCKFASCPICAWQPARLQGGLACSSIWKSTEGLCSGGVFPNLLDKYSGTPSFVVGTIVATRQLCSSCQYVEMLICVLGLEHACAAMSRKDWRLEERL
jgi:hypothetical protein